MELILALDVGTTGMKTLVVNTAGTIIKTACIEYGMIEADHGIAEQEVQVWWQAALRSFQRVLTPDICRNLKAIGVSGQFQSLVMLDRDFSPLRKAILWCDHRGEEFLPEITKRVGKERLMEITANPALSGSSVSSLLWVRRYEPEIFEKCCHIMLPHEYIRFRMTGECVTDVTSASSMQLLDVPERKWSDELFIKLELDKELVGSLKESIEIVGKTTEMLEKETGVPRGLPVVAGGGDSVISAIGTGTIKEESCFTSLGTSGIICTNIEKVVRDEKGRVNTYCSAVPGMWSVITCSITVGFALKWMKENFYQAEEEQVIGEEKNIYDKMCAEAAKIPRGAEGLIFLPYLLGDRTPHLDAAAKGMFFGLNSKHRRSHFTRAVLEGTGYSLVEGIEVLEELGLQLNDFVLCGGGAKGKLWRQILADMYGHDVTTVQNDSGSAMGAAVLAACGSGVFSNLDEAVSWMVKRNKKDKYSEENHAVYSRNINIYKKLYDRTQDLFLAL